MGVTQTCQSVFGFCRDSQSPDNSVQGRAGTERAGLCLALGRGPKKASATGQHRRDLGSAPVIQLGVGVGEGDESKLGPRTSTREGETALRSKPTLLEKAQNHGKFPLPG